MAGAALGDHQRPDRLHGAVAALRRARARPDWAARAALTASSGSDLPCRWRSCRSPVDLDDPDTGSGHVPGQARAVAAGALDTDQGDGPEPAQPAQQASVAGRGSRELLDAEQPPDGIQRGSDMHVGVGVDAAGDGALSSTMVMPSLFCG